MVLGNTLEYISQPLETVDIAVLRNAVVCGITALVMVMVGLSKLLLLVFYLLVVGIITVIAWLYSLECTKRSAVIERVKEVFCSLLQACVDQVAKEPVKSKLDSTTMGENEGVRNEVSGARSGGAPTSVIRSDGDLESRAPPSEGAVDYSGLFE